MYRQVSPGQPPADTTLPPVRAQNVPVEVSFTQLETDHLPARETREQEISAHKAKAKVVAPVCALSAAREALLSMHPASVAVLDLENACV